MVPVFSLVLVGIVGIAGFLIFGHIMVDTFPMVEMCECVRLKMVVVTWLEGSSTTNDLQVRFVLHALYFHTM